MTDSNNLNQPTPGADNKQESSTTATAVQSKFGTTIARLKARLKPGLKDLLSYFNLNADLEPQQEAEQDIRSGVSFKGSQLLILIFAIFVASLGLNTDSVPVIIGAMLISPLMGPIIGMGLGLGINDFQLLRRGLKNILMAMLGSILASALYFLISPQYEGSSQLLARTSPSIYDVLIALFGGAAGIVSIACKNKGQVMPGVAIATSLMPPLCTVGYGLATWQAQYFFGALYLFFTNMVFILFATWIGVKLFGYKKVVYRDPIRAHRVQTIVYIIVSFTILLSVYLTVQMFKKNIFLNKAADFVKTEMVFPNTQVLSHQEYISGGQKYIDVTLIGEALPLDSLKLALLDKLDADGLQGTILNIKQGFASEKAELDQEKTIGQFYSLMQKELASRQMAIDSLKAVIAVNHGFSNKVSELSPEIKVLFPNIRDIALTNMQVSNVESNYTDTVNVVFLKVQGSLPSSEQNKLKEYLGVRLNRHNIKILVNPSSFPWPGDN